MSRFPTTSSARPSQARRFVDARGKVAGPAWFAPYEGGPIGSHSKTLSFDDNRALAELAGDLGANLEIVARTLRVEVHQRGADLHLDGDEAPVELAERVLDSLYELVIDGHMMQPADVRHAIRICRDDPQADLAAYFADTVLVRVDGRPIVPRSAGQQRYLSALRKHDVVFGAGPAGTGKTYLAMAVAVAALVRGEVRKIIMTRPAVEAGEKLGFLPGDLTEKVDPYLRPLYDALQDMLPAERVQRMLEREVIEVAPLAFMRGRTLSGAYVVLDEAQNTTREQMKMFLTRLGEGSRMVINGDPSQIDLPRRDMSGLVQALQVLNNVERIGIVHLTAADVVRHPLVADIINAYDRHK